jgi:hypothetical protein
LLAVALLTIFGAAPLAAATIDADGVAMMFPAKTGGTSYRLGANNPMADKEHLKLKPRTVEPGMDGVIKFWRSAGERRTYASGAPDGTTRGLIVPSGTDLNGAHLS